MTPVRRRRCAAAAVSAALIHLPAWAQEPPSRAALPAPQPAAQAAPSESLPIPALSLADVTEEGQHLLRATVTLKGEPLQGARVQFGAARTFGVLDLGTDTSLDDGTAAIPFPEGLPYMIIIAQADAARAGCSSPHSRRFPPCWVLHAGH